MGAALSIVVLLSISVFVVRVAAVALRLTGLAEDVSRFQALSAFTGTGFTTAEAETVVNYPVRRRILGVLMVIGNLGVVTFFATVVVSFVNRAGDVGAMLEQVAWIGGGMALLWFLILNPAADRYLCNLIGLFLTSTTRLGNRRYHRLLQIGDGLSICEHPGYACVDSNNRVDQEYLYRLGLTVLAIRTKQGAVSGDPSRITDYCNDERLILFGRDSGHDELELRSPNTNPLA